MAATGAVVQVSAGRFARDSGGVAPEPASRLAGSPVLAASAGHLLIEARRAELQEDIDQIARRLYNS